MATRISITDFGAKGDGRTDNTAAIQRAFDEAAKTGATVFIPEGVFNHSGVLRARGIDIEGVGDASHLRATTPTASAIHLTGDGPSIQDVMISVVGVTKRINGYDNGGITLIGATNFRVEDVTIDSPAATGILLHAARDGVVKDNTVRNTGADSIHMVDESRNLVIENNHIIRSGDDGISVVSYGKHGGPVTDIVVRNNLVEDNKWARGLSVVGGERIQLLDNTVKSPADHAGIYIAQEDSYDTLGVRDVTVSGNRLIDAGGTKTGHGAITVYSAGTRGIEGVRFEDNWIEQSRKHGVTINGSKVNGIALDANVFDGGPTSAVHVMNGARGISATNNNFHAIPGADITFHNTPAGNVTASGNYDRDPGAFQGAPRGPGQGTDAPPPTPTDPPPGPAPTPAEPDPVVWGSGPDSVVLKAASQDFRGDAQFQFLVDGKAVGPVMTVAADHGKTWQEFTLRTDLPDGAGTVGVKFLNDLYAAGVGDRNMVVGGLSVNGAAVVAEERVLTRNGDYSYDRPAAAQPPAPPKPPAEPAPPAGAAPVSWGQGPDAIVVRVASQDFRGDAQFQFLVDGAVVGPAMTVGADHGQGWQTFTLRTDIADGADTVGVRFVNDHYQKGVGDRNLVLAGLEVNGKVLADGERVLGRNGDYGFDLPPGVVQSPPVDPMDTVVVRAAGQSWNGHAQFRLLADGAQVGGVQTATTQAGSGWQEFVFRAELAEGTRSLQVEFLNDAYGGPGKDRNLHVDAVVVNGREMEPDRAVLARTGEDATVDVSALAFVTAPQA
jgi:hypothetical protein